MPTNLKDSEKKYRRKNYIVTYASPGFSTLLWKLKFNCKKFIFIGNHADMSSVQHGRIFERIIKN